MSEPFGFTVTPPQTVQYPGYTHTYGWRVYLPHQCDDWQITNSYDGQPQRAAIAELERFIAEAQQALTALREGRAFGEADDR